MMIYEKNDRNDNFFENHKIKIKEMLEWRTDSKS